MALSRSRRTAARSKSSLPLASSISPCRRVCTSSDLPERNSRTSDDDPPVGLGADPADAGRRAALDLVLQAGPGARGEDAVAAAAQGERLEQGVERVVDRTGRGERPEILGLRPLGAAMLADQRELVAGAQEDVGEALVVAQDDVERRPVPLDQVGLEQQRLDLARGGDELHRAGQRHHALQPGRQPLRLGVGRHPLPERFGLADVERLAALVEHAVDPRLVRQGRDEAADQLRASECRDRRRRLAGRWGHFGHGRLVGTPRAAVKALSRSASRGAPPAA